MLHGPFERSELTIDGLHDRAMIYVDGKLAGIQERTGRRSDSVYLELEPGQTAVLRILVENMGRINYGAKLLDRKGILRGGQAGMSVSVWLEALFSALRLPAAARI